jgi:adenosylmethionine-8-amino-7-oxononanoate aminotransferase
MKNVVKTEGCILRDEQGRQFVDLESGVWVVPLGHNHPTINEAIIDQLDKVTHCGYYNSSLIVDEADLVRFPPVSFIENIELLIHCSHGKRVNDCH